MNDDGELLLAIADDFLAAFPPDDRPLHSDDVYDWLIAQAHKIGDPPAPVSEGGPAA